MDIAGPHACRRVVLQCLVHIFDFFLCNADAVVLHLQAEGAALGIALENDDGILSLSGLDAMVNGVFNERLQNQLQGCVLKYIFVNIVLNFKFIPVTVLLNPDIIFGVGHFIPD